MNNGGSVCLIATVVLATAVIILIVRNSAHTKERFDPQDMGGRNFWGFGREYGYAQWDNDYLPQMCYQISSRYFCRPGYHRAINPATGGSECCPNSYVY